MSSDRRKFLQQLAAGTAWATLGLGAKALGVEPAADDRGWAGRLRSTQDDEAYWEEVRKSFDLPQQCYLNTGTLGLMPRQVLAAVKTGMNWNAVGRNHQDHNPREALARLFHVSPESIALTHNTTESINIAAAGLRLRKGDEVIVSDQEHVGNALPWLNQVRLRGIKLKVLSPAPTAAENIARIEAMVTRRTRVIALPHANCTVGQVLPAKEISALARQRGIVTVWDGAHGPGMLFPDLTDMGCDIYAACGHKWLCGPAGTGILYIRPEMLGEVEALMVGAYSDVGWELSQEKQQFLALQDNAHRYDYGTQSTALFEGLHAAIEFMEAIGIDKVRARIAALGQMLQDRLLEKSYVEMLSPTEAASRAGMIGFRIKGRKPADFEGSELLRRFRFRQVPESGLDSLRISTHLYNSKAEIEEFVDALDRFVRI